MTAVELGEGLLEIEVSIRSWQIHFWGCGTHAFAALHHEVSCDLAGAALGSEGQLS